MNKYIILILLLAIPAALAQPLVNSPQQLPVYVCAPATFEMVLSSNTTLGIGIFSDHPNVTYTPDRLWIKEPQKVQMHINTPCDAEQQVITTQIVTVSGDTYETRHLLVPLIPNNIRLVAYNTTATTTACGTAQYELNLTNPVNFTETYSFTTQGVSSELENITLEPGKSKTFTLEVTPDDCKETGEKSFKLLASTKKTKLTAELDFLLEIDSLGVPEYDFPSRIWLTHPKNRTFQIHNPGEPTSYIIRVEGVEWAKAEPEILDIENDAEFTLYIDAPAESTKTTANITITSVETGNKYAHEMTLWYHKKTWAEENWYLILLAILAIGLAVPASIWGYRYGTRKDIAKRRAKKIQERKDSILGAWRARKLKRARKRKAIARQRAEKRKAKEERLQQPKTRLRILFKTLIAIAILAGAITVLALYGSIVKTYALYVIAAGAIIGATIALSRRKKPPRKQVVKELAKAYKKPYRQKDQAQEGSYAWLLLLAGALLVAGAAIQYLETIKPYAYYLITGIAVLAAIIIFVPKTKGIKGIEGNAQKTRPPAPVPGKKIVCFNTQGARIAYASRKNLRLYKWEGNWKEVQLESTPTAKKLYTAELDAGTYALTKETSRQAWWVIAGLSLAALVAMSVTLPDKSFGIPDQVWEKGKDHYLDLEPYFEDPDGENLTYTSSTEGPITIDIQGSVARLISPQDWEGQQLATFKAIDSQGEEAESNKVKLIVETPLKKYISYGFLATFILSTLLALRKRQQPLTEHPQ